MPPIVVGTPVAENEPSGSVKYVSASAGADTTYLVRSDGAVDRVRGGSVKQAKVYQRLLPPDRTTYVAASAGIVSSYLLRADGQVDRVKGGNDASVKATIQPAEYPKVKYVAVSNSQGPCYLLRSDGGVDMYRAGKEMEALAAPYTQLSGGTEDSYFLAPDGSVDRVYAFGRVGNTYPAPASTKYVGVATQCVMLQNEYGGGHLHAMYVVRADGKVDRITGAKQFPGGVKVETMEPPAGVLYEAASCLDQATYLLRSDGAVDRTTGFGKIDNTMNPPPGQTYVQVSAGQFASYFVRSDGMVDRSEGFGRVQKTLSPEAEQDADGCSVM